MIYDIANLKVEIKNENGRTEKQAIPYLAQNQDEKNIDITIDVDEKRVLQAMKEHRNLCRTIGNICLPALIFIPNLLNIMAYFFILRVSWLMIMPMFSRLTAERVSLHIHSFGLNISAIGHIYLMMISGYKID